MKSRISCLLGSALAVFQLAACQKAAPFNPALAGHFFPLRTGLTWTYQVSYPNGGHETITDRVLNSHQTGTMNSEALVVSAYSGHGIHAVRANLPQAYPAETTEIETRYLVEGSYITRVANLGGASGIRFEERGFLPQHLWPNRVWSNTLSPFESAPGQLIKVAQNHKSYLESDEVVVPAGHFARCMRIETEASYESPAGIGEQRYFKDWYAPDVGLVKTLVVGDGPDQREIARIELLRFTKLQAAAPLLAFNPKSIAGSSRTGNRARTAGVQTGQ